MGLEWVIWLLVILFVLTQVAWPLVVDKPLFPLFRHVEEKALNSVQQTAIEEDARRKLLELKKRADRSKPESFDVFKD